MKSVAVLSLDRSSLRRSFSTRPTAFAGCVIPNSCFRKEGRCWQSVFANMRLHGRSLPWMPRASTRSTFIKRRVAMREAVLGLQPSPDHLLIDALMLDCDLPQRAIIHGDALSASIAAASIVAKVERDRMVVEWDPVFPVYGLASNKGYSTPRHLTALREHGPSPLHRQSFAPVWNAPVPQEVLQFMLAEETADELPEMMAPANS